MAKGFMATPRRREEAEPKITRFELMASRQCDRLSIRGNETFRGFQNVVRWENIGQVVAGEGREFIKKNRVHGDKVWNVVGGHAFAIVNEVVGNVWGITAVGIGGDTAGVIIENMRKGESTEDAPIRCRR